MEFTELPFEYETRYGDQYKEWGIPMERAALLEGRDRQLEDYLADLSTEGGGFPWVLVAASDAPDKVKAVADFTCDGTADDVEIQQAVDQVGEFSQGTTGSMGAVVYLSEGTFNLTAAIDAGTDSSSADYVSISFVGQGPAATRMVGNAKGHDGLQLAQSGDTQKVEGIRFEKFDTAVGRAASSFIDDYYLIRNCFFWDNVVGFSGATSQIRIVECMFESCDDWAIYLGAQGTHLLIEGNQFYYNTDDISIDGAYNAAIVDNVTEGNGTFFEVRGSSDGVYGLTVAGNVATFVGEGVVINTGANGIQGLTVAGNTLEGWPGLRITSSAGATSYGGGSVVSGNNIFQMAYLDAPQLQVVGNFVGDSMTLGPSATGLVTGNTIGDPTIKGADGLTDNSSGGVSLGGGNLRNGTWT